MMLEQRSIVKAVIFSLITCGLYYIYWVYKQTEEAHAVYGERTTASGGMVLLFSLITCGIYGVYWYYKMGVTLNMAKEARSLRFDSSAPIVYLVLSIFGLGLVSSALIQDGLNDIILYDESNGGAPAGEESQSGGVDLGKHDGEN